MPINDTSPTIGNSALGGGTNDATGIVSSGIIPVRVIDVSLESDSHPESLFQVSKEWAGIGAIRFESLNKGSNKKEFPQGNIAYPFDINFKKIPLIGEIVYILSGPSPETLLEGDSNKTQFYYLNPISPWNSNHLNLLPSPSSGNSKSTDTVDTNSVTSGIENNTETQIEQPTPGKTFEEKDDVRNLFPNEGDTIIEGRFGNSLRFGSTARQPQDKKSIESPWSTEGQNGQPITILRNGQTQTDLPFNNWFPIYEDVQNDDSSIYMTSGQTIPVRLGSTNFASFGIDAIPISNTTKLIQEVPVQDPNLSNKELDDVDNPYDTVNQEPTRVENNFLNQDSLNELNTLGGNQPIPSNTNYGDENSPRVRETSTDNGFRDEVVRDNNGRIPTPESTNPTVTNNVPARSGTSGTRIATGSNTGIGGDSRNFTTSEI